MTAKEKQIIIKKIEQRQRAQQKANRIQREIDEFFQAYNISCEYFCSDIVLYCEPDAAATTQKEKVFKYWETHTK